MVDEKINILTTSGYFKRFFQHLQNARISHAEAYRKVELELERMNAPKKYSDYNSFKRNKHYHLKKKGNLK